MRKILFIILITLITASFVAAEMFFVNNDMYPGGVPDPQIISSSYEDYEYEVFDTTYIGYLQDNPNTGIAVRFEREGIYVGLGPDDLQYVNDYDLQFINAVQSVTGSPSGDVMTYPDAYGSGIDLTYTVGFTQLKEGLVIADNNTLPAIETYMLGAGEIFIELNFVLTTNADLEVEGVDWDQSTSTRTYNDVYIKDSSTGKIVYHIPRPFIEDAVGARAYGWLEFKKSGTKLYVSVGVPQSFLSTAVFPVNIDPTFSVDYSPIPGIHLLNGTVDAVADSVFENSTDITAGISDNNDSTNYSTRLWGRTGGDAVNGGNSSYGMFSWEFHETSGTTVQDLINGWEGTVAGLDSDLSVDGFIGSGLYVNSSESAIAENLSFFANDYDDTVQCVAFRTNQSFDFIGDFYSTWSDEPKELVRMEMLSNGRVKVTFKMGSVSGQITTGVSPVYDDDAWHSACLFVNASGADIELFIDGISEGSSGIGVLENRTLDKVYVGNGGNDWEGFVDESCAWSGPSIDALSIVADHNISGCTNVGGYKNYSKGVAINGHWNQTYVASYNWFLRLRKVNDDWANITVFAYDDDDNVSNLSVSMVVDNSGWFNINVSSLMYYELNTVGLNYTNLRFYTDTPQSFSEVLLRKEVNDSEYPVINNCWTDKDNLSCSETFTLTCNVTDNVDVGNVNFTVNSNNYTTTKTGDLYSRIFAPAGGGTTLYNWTNVLACDILGQCNTTNPGIVVNYTCTLESTPNITAIQSIPSVTLSPFTNTSVEVLFNVSDANGYTDLNDSLAYCNFTKTGEAIRTTNICSAQQQSGDDLVYNCSLDMSFYDSAGLWNVSCYAEDITGRNDTELGNVTVNDLHHITQDVQLLNWSNVYPSLDDAEADGPIVFSNGGNQDYTTITITSQNATYSTYIIQNNVFSVDNATGQTTGQTYLNDTGVIWTGETLDGCTSPCSTNSTLTSYHYVDLPTGIGQGTYVNVADWTISFS